MAKATQRTIPDSSTYGYVDFSILSDGKEVDTTYEVLSIVTMKEANRVPSAKLVIRDGDAAAETFEVSESDYFTPGKEIEVKVGYDGTTKTIFKGLVVKHGIKVRSGQTILSVECKDACIKMTEGRQSKYFEKKKDSDIIKDVLSKYGLAGKIDPTKLQHQEVVQNYVTDWDFLVTRAEMNGLLVFANDGKVDVKEPKVEGKASLELLYGATMLEFEAEMDARHQYKEVVARSWSYKDQKLVEQKGSSSFAENGNISGSDLSKVLGLKSLELRHSGQVLKEELQSWASAQMLKSKLSKIRGWAKFTGYGDLKPGDIVLVDGVGKRFNGNVYVTAIRQEVVDGNWLTTFQFGLAPEWFHQQNPDLAEPLASGLVPAVHGLQIGKVVQLKEDPDGEDRILVKLPVIDPNAKGIWCRVSTLDAGKERGSFYRPEIDDEVIVGFINDDPRDAIVLGMLHSSAKPAPIKATDENHEKGFVTRSKMRVWFDDDKKIMTLDTPAKNLIEISEEGKSITIKDQNDNKIVLNEKGIEIYSPKDIKVTADGLIDVNAKKDISATTKANMNLKASSNIKAEASQKVEVKASMDCKIEGLNVGIKANVKLDAEGTAGATLKAAAITEVKGALVKIN